MRKEPVLLSNLFVAAVVALAAFTSFTTEQDLALQGLAIAAAAYFARSRVTPIDS